MSWKPEVQTDDSGKWYGNALRFATKEEAEAQVKDLMMRWFAVREIRAVEAPAMDLPDRANYFSMQMKLLLGACPEMHKEFKLSALRHFVNPEQKNNVA